MWQRWLIVVGGLLLVGGLLGALHLNHVEAVAVSARVMRASQSDPRKRFGTSPREYRWLERQETEFDLALVATAIGIMVQTFAAAFRE